MRYDTKFDLHSKADGSPTWSEAGMKPKLYEKSFINDKKNGGSEKKC